MDYCLLQEHPSLARKHYKDLEYLSSSYLTYSIFFELLVELDLAFPFFLELLLFIALVDELDGKLEGT